MYAINLIQALLEKPEARLRYDEVPSRLFDLGIAPTEAAGTYSTKLGGIARIVLRRPAKRT